MATPTLYDSFFRAVIYPESNDVKQVCLNLDCLSVSYCYILHDKDIEAFENGEPVYKKPHYHFIIISNKPKTNKMLMHALNMPIVYCGIPLNSTTQSLYRYLVHLDEPLDVDIPKTRYPVDAVMFSDINIRNLYYDAVTAPVELTIFNPDDHLDDTEVLFLDLNALHCGDMSLKEFLCVHKEYLRYFNQLERLYKTIFKEDLLNAKGCY